MTSRPPRTTYPPDEVSADLREEADVRALEGETEEGEEMLTTAADVIDAWTVALRRIARGEANASAIALGALMAWGATLNEPE
ncbi:hypothetical protein [Salinarimonas soli]|uniref:Uncharacterized protein n=1 Tax=Salinarimonas soli TaxID=1638099 RepID=A0A5B2VGN8_9HYPH|nr:hypothetical protein [Salinarimonas soli]KAA2237680.1 hypothetical protein F0L46_08345 [Salinarimonas soli]